MWAITDSGRLIRIDPTTNRVTFSEHIAGLRDMAAGSGAIWVVTSAGKPDGQVLKIDPAGGQIVAAFPLQRRCEQVAFGGGQLWLACGSGATTFLRLDPASGRVLAEGGPAHNVNYIAATADGVWYANDWGVSGFVGKRARLRWVHATDVVIPVFLGYTDSLVYGQGFLLDLHQRRGRRQD